MAKTTTTIGTVTTTAGYEATPEGFHPDGSLHIAPDGRAIVVYAYCLVNGFDAYRFAFRYSDENKQNWTDEIVILNPGNNHTGNNIQRISSYMDPSGHVYVGMLYYMNFGFGRSWISYCKLTKSGGTWTAGTVESVTSDYQTLAPRWTQLHMCWEEAFGPYIAQNGWITQNGAVSYGIVWKAYGAYWDLCHSSSNALNADVNVTCMLAVGGGARVFVSKADYSSDDLKITAVVGSGVDGLGIPRWSNLGSTNLWTGPTLVSATENWGYFGINVLYIGHPLADFVCLARLSDGSLRLKKYKIGTGWSGDIILKESGAYARSTQVVWDASTGLLHFWWTHNQAPGTYNPTDDSIDTSGLDLRTTVTWPYFVDGYWYGYKASGSAGTSTQSFTTEQRAFLRRARHTAPVETRLGMVGPVKKASFESRIILQPARTLQTAATGWVYPSKGVPDENRWMLVRPRSTDMVFEQLALMRQGRSLVFDAQSQLQNGVATAVLPLDIRTTHHRTESLPMEWRKGWPNRAEGPVASKMVLEILKGVWATQDVPEMWFDPIVVILAHGCPLEIPGGVGREVPMVFEGLMPISDAVYHDWNVFRKSVGVFPQLWRVVDQTQYPTIGHQWVVIRAQGGSFPQLWRVLPAQLITLSSEDIQLPYGTIEKV